MKKFCYFSIFIFFSVLFFSCTSLAKNDKYNFTLRTEPVSLHRTLLGGGILTASEMRDYFLSQNPNADAKQVMRLAQFYIIEGTCEYINYSVAFAQMCLETGYLRFGNLVVPEMHNYCGLGAMDAQHPGEWFETEQLGVRAHIQHLQAYATTEEVQLNQPLIDPRYSWVHKTKFAEDIHGLSKNWATDPEYGNKIEKILQQMEDFVNSRIKDSK